MSSSRLLAAAVLAALLAACNGDSPQEGEVTGEVLEGTISDEMLPLDRVQSEAPLADPTGTSSGSASDAETDASAAPESEGEADGAPIEEPVAEPAEAEE